MKNKILFVGNFLQESTGSLGPSVQIATSLSKERFNVVLASKKLNLLSRLFDILKHVIFTNYRIIHIDAYSGKAFIFCVLSTFIAKARRKKIIITLHGGKLPEFHLRFSKLVESTLRKADYLNSPSQYLISFFKEKSIDISYMPNPIHLEKFPARMGSFRPRSILWVRAFASIYNPSIAVQILEGIKSKFPDATLTMIGPDKGLFAQTEELIKNKNLSDSIKITGPIPNNQLNAYYQSHHVYINTTSFESFGISLVEAASSGIAIVTNKVGEIPFMWKNQENILMVEENNIHEFINQISILFNDSKFYQILTTNAQEHLKKFDFQSIIKEWEKFF